MIVLGIDTATTQVGAAIGGHEGVLASFHAAHGRRHAEDLAPAIQFVCRAAGRKLSDVSAIAVDVGPGLFTGLRVGVATAKALAHALRVPVIGLPSLDLLAFAVRYSNRRIVPVVDARRGEVYSAEYRHVSDGVQRVSPYRICSPDDLASDLVADSGNCLLVGDGALRYSDVFSKVSEVELGTVGNRYPSADALVELAHPKALREEFVQPWELHPLYLRQSDAEINWPSRESA
jgi:tRNA threonylcarbamoyladenosine biosynthesis protein TsaB